MYSRTIELIGKGFHQVKEKKQGVGTEASRQEDKLVSGTLSLQYLAFVATCSASKCYAGRRPTTVQWN